MRCGFIPVANTASVELIYSMNGEVCENVFHVKKGSAYSLADLQAVRTIANNWDATSQSALRGVYASLTRIRTRALDSVGAPFEDYSLPAPRAGGQGGTTLPGDATFAVKKATLSAGRSYRGRWYFVGLTSNFYGVNANVISPLAAGNLVTSLNGLITALAAGGHTMVVVSYVANKQCRAAGVTTTVTGFVTVDLAVDSQRRRLQGRGHP